MVYDKAKKAAQGIGTLIIFIALILVAAVAAGVLIQTAGSLQSKSLDVGRQTQEKITTDIDVVQVYANDTSNGNITADLARITVVVRLGSGSAPVKLDDMLIRFDTESGTQSLTYGGRTTSDRTNSTYRVQYRINGSNHQDDYVANGDLAEISFIYGGTVTDNIDEAETATLRIVTKNGAIKPVVITTPSAMIEAITYLYP